MSGTLNQDGDNYQKVFNKWARFTKIKVISNRWNTQVTLSDTNSRISMKLRQRMRLYTLGEIMRRKVDV